MLEETGLGAHFKLSNIVSIVEPRSFLRLIHTLPNIIHQVEAADLVLLNKCDLYDEAQLADTEGAVLNIKPAAAIRRCVMGKADFSVFGASGNHNDLHGEYAKCRDPRYSAFSIELPGTVDTTAILAIIDENEDAVYRVKGYIPADTGAVYFDYSTAGISLTATEARDTYGLAWICTGEAAERIEAKVRSIL
jgi:G3E family GTPase